jgi:hypothetical protein
MKPIHLILIAGVGFLLLKRRIEPVRLPKGTVYAPTEKPIPFPTDFQYEEMPLSPISVTPRSESLFDRVFSSPDAWSVLREQGRI